MKKTSKLTKIIFLTLAILLNAFIIVEASLPPEISAKQSEWISNIFAGIINNNMSTSQDVTELESITIKNASGDSDIVVGTTERLDVTLEPSNVSNKDIVYTASSSSVNLVPSGSSVFVEALGNINDEVVITATSNNKSVNYTFNLVDRLSPISFIASTLKQEIEVNQSELINIKMIEDEIDDQYRLIRYYDPSKITYTSLDPSIATISNGYIKGLKEGETKIILNKDLDSEVTIPISVVSSSKPLVNMNSDFTLSLNKDLHVYDLDYAKEHSEIGSYIDITFNGDTPSDTNFYYESLDPLVAIVSQKGRIYGYKKSGVARIKATSIADPLISKVISVNVTPVKATSFTINQDTSVIPELMIGKNITINASFEPYNTTDISLLGEVSDTNKASITSSGRSLSLTALNEGDVKVTIKSKSNPDLVKTFKIKVIKKEVINEDNYSDFHSFTRKALGHMALFFIDAIFTCLAFYYWLKDYSWFNEPIGFLISLLTGFSVAGISEIAQIFVERGASFKDVMIDTCGFLIGALIFFIIVFTIRIVKKHKHKDNIN